MVVKKPNTKDVLEKTNDVTSKNETAKPESKTEKTTITKGKKQTSVKPQENFCVYIGPSIRGVIQSGTIYDKSRKDTISFLAPAIKKYPLITKLVVTDKTIAEDRIKVKTAGNLLNVFYKRLAGKSN